jgi:lysophospholipase L1-like esterase
VNVDEAGAVERHPEPIEPIEPAPPIEPPLRRWPRLVAAMAIGFVVGLTLVLLALLDVTNLSNWLAMILAVLAHATIAVFVVQLVVVISRRAPLKVVLGWVALIGVLSLVAYKIDEFIVRTSPIGDGWKVAYVVSAAVATGAGLVAMALFVSSSRVATHDTFTRALVLGYGALALGVALPIVVVAPQAAHRQGLSSGKPIEAPGIPGITGTYVALGDSYSAGEGLKPFQPGSPGNCHRSPYAYPLLLQFDNPVRREFRACSGAVTTDIDRGVLGGYPPQLDRFADPTVTLVTITIGGNDVVFSDVVQACFVFHDCISGTFTPRAFDPARPDVTYPDPKPFDAWAVEAVGLLVDRLDRVYASIREAYPNARVVVLGYPYLFPDGDAPANLSDCAIVLRRVSKDERHQLRNLTDQLNAEIDAHARAIGFDFISPVSAWDGHEPCGTDGQYTNALLPSLRISQPIDTGTFHPNRRGQEQLAQLIACYLIANPEAPVAQATPTSPVPGSLEAPITCPAKA